MSEMYYRPGTTFPYQGTVLDTLITDELEPPAGWHRLGELFDETGKAVDIEETPSERTAAEIIASLDGLSADELTALWATEGERPKPRKGVLAAIEKAQAALTEG
jgi:hypothetical protein